MGTAQDAHKVATDLNYQSLARCAKAIMEGFERHRQREPCAHKPYDASYNASFRTVVTWPQRVQRQYGPAMSRSPARARAFSMALRASERRPSASYRAAVARAAR